MEGTVTISISDYEKLNLEVSKLEDPLKEEIRILKERIDDMAKNMTILKKKDFDFLYVTSTDYINGYKNTYTTKNNIPLWIKRLFS